MDMCIFCQIADKSVGAEIVEEGDLTLAIYDKFPKAKIHILIIPKRHVERPDQLLPDELAELFELSRLVAERQKITENGYKLCFNVGKKAGQEIDHVHLHLLSD